MGGKVRAQPIIVISKNHTGLHAALSTGELGFESHGYFFLYFGHIILNSK
jgi:hypothetical protein